jgi:Zn-dependent protease
MDPAQGIVLFAVWYVVFLLSLTCHEAAHAFVALRGGDDTAYRAGQVTLNPLPHIQREPIGTIVVPLFTYSYLGFMMGWASAPYDPTWGGRHPKRAALMALAGPLANLVLAGIGFAALRAGLHAGLFEAPHEIARYDHLVFAAEGATWVDGLGRLLSVMVVLNLTLFFFNLIPLPPMDGASVLSGLFLPARRLHEKVMATPFGSLLGLLVASTIFPKVFWPVLNWIVVRLYL